METYTSRTSWGRNGLVVTTKESNNKIAFRFLNKWIRVKRNSFYKRYQPVVPTIKN